MFCPKCGIENPDNGKFCRSCGTDLAIVSLALSGNLQIPQYTVDPRKRAVSWETAVTTIAAGAAMLIISIFLGVTGIIGAANWWFWLLIGAFAALANGITKFISLRRLEKLEATFTLENTQNRIPSSPQNNALPPIQTEFVKPQGSIYETGDFVTPSSVTENTTRHLEINKEGETITLPKLK